MNTYKIQFGDASKILKLDGPAVIITDKNVKKYYGDNLLKALKKQKIKVDLLAFQPGEISKNQKTVTYLQETMLKKNYLSNTTIIALGGGVVGDTAGFVAATYMRGIKYIQIPTTLLAMVDSSIGGKTGINTPYGKNQIGAFWHPSKIIIDLKFLSSKQCHAYGLVEIAKVFMTSDKKTFKFMEDDQKNLLKKNILTALIKRAIQIKLKIVERDERDKGERHTLNFGHTIGHAIENLSKYRIPHGEAVAWGILVEAKMSVLDGFLSGEDYERIKKTILAINVLKENPFKKMSQKQLVNVMNLDKKNMESSISYTAIKGIGAVVKNNGKYMIPMNQKSLKIALTTI
jgi:3-dehydroquinate synthase